MWHIIECKSNTWGFMEISVEISKNYCQYIVLTPNSAPRGNLFSIPIHIISSIFTLLTVTHGRGLMCIKNNTLLINKQHPSHQLVSKSIQKFKKFKKNYIIIAFTDVTNCFLSWKKIERTEMFRMNPLTLMIEFAIHILWKEWSFLGLLSAWLVIFPWQSFKRISINSMSFIITLHWCLSTTLPLFPPFSISSSSSL